MKEFSLLIKPSGSDCNLDCGYCFYKDRDPAIGSGRQRMTVEVLDQMTSQFLGLGFAHPAVAWQGGEPTLMGLDFYKKVVEVQRKYAGPDQQPSNALQTNAVLLDDNWCRFLGENNFLVGISLDGPADLHDYYRLDIGGQPTFDRVMAAIRRCKEHQVEFNILTLVNRKNAEHPDRIFDFLVDNGIAYMQFIPCFELDQSGKVADFSVTPEQYGRFLCRLFDRWYEYGPEKILIRDFESMAGFFLTGQHSICTFGKKCDHYLVVEHNGDVYPCDFFVRSENKLGNIMQTSFEQLNACRSRNQFARCKRKLPFKCQVCSHLEICRGGCPKDRLDNDRLKFDGLSYFCESYKQFYSYAKSRLAQLAARAASGDFNRQI